jgi:hypothetical protein
VLRYNHNKAIGGFNMKEKMIQFFEGCGYNIAEAEKETAIHIREIKRVELPDMITDEQACEIFMADVIE